MTASNIPEDRAQLAAKVRAGRAILGWSQSELGEKTGLSQRSINRLELGIVDVRRSTAFVIETAFRDFGVRFEEHPGGFRVVVEQTPIAHDQAA
jgi:transcriptional regulator with XRE-family HTH domain